MFRFPHHRPTDEPERDILARAAAWPRLRHLRELDAAALQDVSKQEGIDFATALLYDRLCRSPAHGPISTDARRNASEPREEPCLQDTDLVLVPGAFHAQRPQTGADGQRILAAARRLGCTTIVVDVPSFGSPADNALEITRTLAAQRPGRRLVLVSLSKGSLDVRRALERPEASEVLRENACWISMSGLATGSPLVGWLRRRPWRALGVRMLFAWHRLPYRVLGEIDRDTVSGDEQSQRALQTAWRSGLRMIHVVGFPLRRHLSCPLARRGHRRLAPLGPNDGGVLLADVCRLPGVVYPIWGADHYLRLPGADVGTMFAHVLSSVLKRDTRRCPTVESSAIARAP